MIKRSIGAFWIFVFILIIFPTKLLAKSTILQQVDNVNVVCSSHGTLTISWDIVDDADGYSVYMSSNQGDSYSCLCSTTQTSYTKSNLKIGEHYSFKIRAYRYKEDGKTREFGAFSNSESQVVNTETPVITKVFSETSGFLTVTWDKVENVDGYSVYYSTSENGNYVCAESTTNTSITKKLTCGKYYYFKVRAYTYINGKKVVGKYSDVRGGYCNLATPTISNVSCAGTGKLNVQWSDIDGAEGYSVYMADQKDGQYTCLGSTSELNYIKSRLVGGKDYYFKVRAYYYSNKIKIFSAFSEIYSATANLGQPTIVNISSPDSKKVTISWNSVKNAEGYSIYMATDSDSSTYTCVGSVVGTVYTQSKLQLNTAYYFKIRPYLFYDGSKVFGPFSDIKSCSTILSSPQITVNSTSGGKITVNWDTIEDADGYSIYMAAAENGEYTCLGSVTGNSYTKSGLVFGTDYYFKVRAYYFSDNGSKKFSAFSDIVKGNCILPAPKISKFVNTTSNTMLIAWNAVDSADYYNIYLSESVEGEFTLAGTTKSDSFELTGLTPLKTYFVKVQACYKSNDVVIEGECSDAKRGVCTLVTPEILSVENTDSGKLTITWTAVEGAAGYSIYMASDSEDSSYTCLASVDSTSYTKGQLSFEKKYYFKVRAYYYGTEGSLNKTFSSYSPVFEGSCNRLHAPTISAFENIGDNSMRLEWSNVDGAEGYNIYLSNNIDEGYNLTQTTTENKCILTHLTTKQTYYVKVCAYVTRDIQIEGFASNVKKGTVLLDAPDMITVDKGGSGKIKVSWNIVDGADGYNLYMSETENEDYACITSATETSYTKSGLNPRKTYYFKIRSYYYAADGVTKIFSEYSDTKFGITGLDQAVLKMPIASSLGLIRLNWNAVVDADGYEVAVATSENGDYSLIDTTSALMYEMDNALTGTVYYFKVRAYYIFDGDKIYGAWSNIRSGTSGLNVPQISSIVQSGSGRLTINWLQVDDAEGYSIYMSENEEGSYEPINSVDAASYEKMSLTIGQTYYFKIRAYYTIDDRKVFSDYSTVQSAKAGIASTTIQDIGYVNGRGIRIVWNKVDGATGYRIFRKDGEGDSWKQVDAINDPATLVWIDNNSSEGNVFFYSVQSICENQYGTTESIFDTVGVSGSAELPTYQIDTTTTPFADKYMKDDRYNQETNSYFTIRSYLDRLDDLGGGTLVIQAGDYNLYGALYISSNVQVQLMDGVKLHKTQSSPYFEFVSQSDLNNNVTYSGYSGVHDASIICPNGGSAFLIQDDTSGVGMVIAHTQNIVIDNLTFEGSTGLGHNIELDASQNVEIMNCTFNGCASDVDVGEAKEAINLDTPDKNTGGFESIYTTYDQTANCDIYIHNNVFRNQLVAVGTHMYSEGHPHINIQIKDNNIDGCIYHAIGAMNWESPIITGNTISNIGQRGEDEGRQFLIKLTGVSHPVVSKNVFSNADHYLATFIARYGADKSETLQQYKAVENLITDEELNALFDNTFIDVTNPYIYVYDLNNKFQIITF